jgi:hypothetical protein
VLAPYQVYSHRLSVARRGRRGRTWRSRRYWVSVGRGRGHRGRKAPGPRVVRRALEPVVHPENLLEKEKQKWVAEPPGQKTRTPT